MRLWTLSKGATPQDSRCGELFGYPHLLKSPRIFIHTRGWESENTVIIQTPSVPYELRYIGYVILNYMVSKQPVVSLRCVWWIDTSVET